MWLQWIQLFHYTATYINQDSETAPFSISQNYNHNIMILYNIVKQIRIMLYHLCDMVKTKLAYFVLKSNEM